MFDLFCVKINTFITHNLALQIKKKPVHTYLVIKNLLQWVGLGNLYIFVFWLTDVIK